MKKVSIVIPAYNEEKILKDNILKIFDFAKKNIAGHDWQIIISDNNSTDSTAIISRELCGQEDKIKYFFQPARGKGGAVFGAWQAYPADINIFMDADLATGIDSLPELIKFSDQGHDIVIGSRNLPESKFRRRWTKKIISWVRNWALRLVLKIQLRDTACGFKAVSKKVVREIVPRVKNQGWFFDTELLFISKKSGFGIKEIPVIWAEEAGARESRGRSWPIIKEYLREINRIR